MIEFRSSKQEDPIGTMELTPEGLKATGAAEVIVRDYSGELSDQAIYDRFRSWSNGYTSSEEVSPPSS